MQDYDEQIRNLENTISTLPSGYISKKTINGKVKKFLQRIGVL